MYFAESSCHAIAAYLSDFFFFSFLWVAHGNKGEKLLEEHKRNRSSPIITVLRSGESFQHSFISFCQFIFIQVRSAAINTVLWGMWENAFKKCPWAVHMCWQKWGILNSFFSASVDVACLQQLIWEGIFSAKEREIEIRQVLLYWWSTQHLYSVSVQLAMFLPDLTPTHSHGKSLEQGKVPSGDSK